MKTRSTCWSSSVLQSTTEKPFFRATSSTPRVMIGTVGFSMLGTISAMVSLLPIFRLWARGFGT